MTPSQTAELLGTIQAFDRRTVGEADIMAWHVALDGIGFDPAKRAVIAHFTASKDWLMPSDIRSAVVGERKRMVAAIPAVVPPWQLADLPADEQRWVASYRHAIADGLPEQQARLRANFQAGITEDPEPLAITDAAVDGLRAEIAKSGEAMRLQQIDRARANEARRAAKKARRDEAQASITAAKEAATTREVPSTGEGLAREQEDV